MTPDQFSHDAAAWLNALSSLFVPLTAFVGGIFGFYAFIKSHMNEKRLNGQSAKIDNLMLASTPPQATQSAPAPTAGVTINNNTDNPTEPPQ